MANEQSDKNCEGPYYLTDKGMENVAGKLVMTTDELVARIASVRSHALRKDTTAQELPAAAANPLPSARDRSSVAGMREAATSAQQPASVVSSSGRKCDSCGQIRFDEQPCSDTLCAFVPSTTPQKTGSRTAKWLLRKEEVGREWQGFEASLVADIKQLERELATIENNFTEYADAHRKEKMQWEASAASAIACIPEGCTPADAMVLREANLILAAENQAMRRCLRFYANGDHFYGFAHWEGPSGDDNWLCAPQADFMDYRQEFIDTMDECLLEDGSIARDTLRTGKFEVESPEEEPALIEGEPEWKIEQAAKNSPDGTAKT